MTGTPWPSSVMEPSDLSISAGFQRLARDERLLRFLMSLVPCGDDVVPDDPAPEVVQHLAEQGPPAILGTIEFCIALLISRSSAPESR